MPIGWVATWRVSIRRTSIPRRTLLLMRRPLSIRHLPRIIHRASRNLLLGERRLHRRTSLLLRRSVSLLLVRIIVRLLRRRLLAGDTKGKPMRDPTLLMRLWWLTIVIRLLLLLRWHTRHGRSSRGITCLLLELLTSLVQERHPSRRSAIEIRHLGFDLLLSCPFWCDLRRRHPSRVVVIVNISHGVAWIRLLRLLKMLWRRLLLLLCPRLRRLRGRAGILLVLGRAVAISSRRTCRALSMPMTTSLSCAWSCRHACRTQRLVVHISGNGSLLLDLPGINRLRLWCSLRWLSSVGLRLGRGVLLWRSLRWPILRRPLLHRTSVRRRTALVLRLRGFLRR